MKINREFEFEVRENQDPNQKNIVEGMACVFNRETDIGWFTEEIDPHAFDETDMSDVVLLFNHDDNLVLAGTRNNSLKLEIGANGLYQAAQVIDTTTGEDVMKLVRNGLINKMSFAFSVSANGEEWTEKDGKEHRVIKKISKLWDVSLVTRPAYDQTFAFARSDELANKHLEEIKRRQEQNKKMEELFKNEGTI